MKVLEGWIAASKVTSIKVDKSVDKVRQVASNIGEGWLVGCQSSHLRMSSVSGSRGLLDCGVAAREADEATDSSSSSSEWVASSPRPSGGGSPSPPSPATLNSHI